MAAVLLGQSSCGRLGYAERARTPTAHADAGARPDEDAGDP
jgi:hypothetical protein